MASKERNTYGKRVVKSPSKVMRIVDSVVLIFTVLAGTMLICAYLSKYVNPNDAWLFAFVGMGAPVLYVVNIVLALYWIIRWKFVAFIPLAILLAGIGSVSLFFRPSLSKHYGEVPSRSLKVLTYNVMGFISDDGHGGKESSLDSMVAFISRVNPDILCIQEFQCRNQEMKDRIDSLLDMPYDEINYTVRNNSGGGVGTAIYSRHRIIDRGTVDLGKTRNSAIWADMTVGRDTIRVLNCHLQTTSINPSDREYIESQEFLSSENREARVRSMASKLRNNFRQRAAQADSITPLISGSPYKVIVCGDFNDTPMSYVYHTIRGGLSDSFVEKGEGIPNTFKGLFNLFRIDFILHSPLIRTLSYDTPDSGYSDHKAVEVSLGIGN